LRNDSTYGRIVGAQVVRQKGAQKALVQWGAADGSMGPVSLLSLNLRAEEKIVATDPYKQIVA